MFTLVFTYTSETNHASRVPSPVPRLGTIVTTGSTWNDIHMTVNPTTVTRSTNVTINPFISGLLLLREETQVRDISV